MEDDYGGVTDSPKRGPTLSTSTSSFEPFDAHDPNLSRLATKMFQKTGDYISHELNTTADDYKLVENMNKVMMGKVLEMKQMSQSIAAKNSELNRKYEELVSMLVNILRFVAVRLNCVNGILETTTAKSRRYRVHRG